MRTARRYAKLFAVFYRTCLVKEMEFRGNFWAGTIIGAVWVSAYLVFAHIIFANTKSVGGWTQGHMVMLFGTYTLTYGIIAVLFSRNLAELPSQIRLGNFDFTLLKPVNSQFFVSTRYLNFTELGTVASATGLVIYGALLDKVTVTPAKVLGYLVMMACGVVIFYSIYLLLMTTAFWFVKVENLWTLAESTSQVARAPMNIYGPLALKFFTFVLPLVFVAHYPTQTLSRGIQGFPLAAALSMAVTFLFISNRFWTYATRFYSSASS